jgi:hypothetical protein
MSFELVDNEIVSHTTRDEDGFPRQVGDFFVGIEIEARHYVYEMRVKQREV